MLTAREIAWSRTDIERPLYISRVTKKEDHTVISYRYLEMDNTFCIPFIDDASIENALNCLAACSLPDDTCRPDNRADGPSRTDCHASGSERRKE